jgi:hypothetical protein
LPKEKIMPHQSAVGKLLAGSRRQLRFEPHLVAVVVTWLAATGGLAVMLLLGVRGSDRFSVARYVLHYACVAALLWHLARSGPSIGQLPESPLGLPPNGRLGRLVAAGAALVLCLTVFVHIALFLLLLVASTVFVLVAWRRQITIRSAALGLAASVLAFVTGGIPFWRFGFVPKPTLIFMLVLIPPMFVAGGLLVARSGLGGVRLIEGRYGTALWSFLRGCVLFVPLGLANAAASSPTNLSWVNRWWHPLVLPLWSGIVEEVIFRTVAVCLCFALLRPALKRFPALAIALAVLLSAATFGLGHGLTLDRFLTTGLGYGLPMAVIFARRDWEHAVGAHYMINMIPWMMQVH